MNRSVLLSLLLAGCAASTGHEVPTPNSDALPQDSPSLHETYPLSPSGIQESWSFAVAGPGGTGGILRFTITGLAGTPLHETKLCFTYAYEQQARNTTRADTGQTGACGGAGNLVVAPEADLDGEILFGLEGSELLPGLYRFQAQGPGQLASLTVDFEPR